jgi:hypothetical protein
MPLVRAIARDAGRNNNRFSALILAVVKSKPFQMNMKVPEPVQRTVSTSDRDTRKGSN